ncbi:MAG: U32 family peptidase, partial [Syntrophobacteraceae bacterium]|nr:U32 family peptidase [Syntrophobacteraceae bacterium]
MKTKTTEKTPELLAPAGNLESFMTAVEGGADAVYLGLKQFSARASAENFTLDELALLIPYAHKRGVSVYVALNSLVAATEIPALLNLLQSLADLKADALIAQDPGVFALRRKYFPHLPLHGSTLMAVHNSAGVHQLARMGATRAVLARESTLPEIGEICAKSEIPVEVFVHGALCYSYSGMCLASSFRGGHSGLQGRCVQPCRLRFRQGNREGFFLSCNDFCALPLIPKLKGMGVAAVKIEGRMKSGDAIGWLVKAYRRVLDAPEKEEEAAIGEAHEWLSLVPSRRLTSGFLAERPGVEVLSPHRSGSSGVWVGTVKKIAGDKLLVAVRRGFTTRDRLRPESSEGKEKKAFTVSAIHSTDGKLMEAAQAGEAVLLPRRDELAPGERLFKVGTRAAVKTGSWNDVKKEVHRGLPFRKVFRVPHEHGTEVAPGKEGVGR